MEFHVADYIYGKSPGSPAYPDIEGSIRSGIGGRMGTGKGKIVSGKKLPTRKQNASSMPSASTVDKDKVYENWRNFDGGDFSLDQDGDWEFSDLYEVDKEDIDSFHVDWEEIEE